MFADNNLPDPLVQGEQMSWKGLSALKNYSSPLVFDMATSPVREAVIREVIGVSVLNEVTQLWKSPREQVIDRVQSAVSSIPTETLSDWYEKNQSALLVDLIPSAIELVQRFDSLTLESLRMPLPPSPSI